MKEYVYEGDRLLSYGSDGKLWKQSNGLEFFYDITEVAGIKYNNEDYMLRKGVLENITGILDREGKIIIRRKDYKI